MATLDSNMPGASNAGREFARRVNAALKAVDDAGLATAALEGGVVADLLAAAEAVLQAHDLLPGDNPIRAVAFDRRTLAALRAALAKARSS